MVQKNPNLPFKTAIRALETFSRYKVPHVIVGGAALVLHGIPRSTLDVDIVIPAEKETIVKVFRAANNIGLKCQQSNVLSLTDKPNLIIGQWITFEDRAGRQLIDIFFEEVKQFKRLYKNSIERQHKKMIFHIASLPDLEKMKKASGRSVDLADVALIREIKKARSSRSKKR